jgi:predicted metal-dependent HD superfamily phosphohydrolase
MLKEAFFELCGRYANAPKLAEAYWSEIASCYSGSKRHYHDLSHLSNLLKWLQAVKDSIHDWDTVLFALYYHDIVYHATKSDNELQSALLAETRMRELGVPETRIAACKSMILATQKHTFSSDADTNYFTDADLAILGEDWNAYQAYFQNVRKEYSVYPDFLYKPGRKKVLKHFLEMERIFKTPFFYEKLEQSCRGNLARELALL